MTTRHFLDIDSLDRTTIEGLLRHAHAMKAAGRPTPAHLVAPACRQAVLAMIFERPSTRTRVSFDVAMRQLGGETLALSSTELQLGRGETIGDTAKVLSRYVDAIVLRTGSHDALIELAADATVPVINGLTDLSHPCQIMADLMTVEERLGPASGRTVAWVGDANNVASSWIHAAGRLGFRLRIAAPESLQPASDLVDWANGEGGDVVVLDDARAAVEGADCVVADTWVSMGDQNVADRLTLLEPYRVDAALMALARPEAIFLHCLPAYRGREVSAEVIDGPQSAVFDEAENRLHAQKAVLHWCFGGELVETG